MTASPSSGSDSTHERARAAWPRATAEHPATVRLGAMAGAAAVGQRDGGGKQADGEWMVRQVLDRSADWVALLDAEARVRWLNACGVRLLGLENVDIRLNHFWLDFWSGEDAAAAGAAADAARAGEVGAFNGLYPTIEGDPRWWDVTVTPIMDGAGRVEHLLAVAREVTGRRRTETALRESEAKWRQITDSIGEVFWQRDVAKGVIVYASPAYEKIWGRPCAKLAAAPEEWSTAIHPADRERVARAVATKLVGGAYNETYRIVRPDGTTRWIHDRAFPLRDGADRAQRVAGTAEDITERQQLEEQFRQAHKMEAIGTLAGGIAHDFNNILTAIIGYTEFARLKLKDNPGVREHLDAVLLAAKRAGDLVRQILTFSRQQPVERRPISLGSAVADCLKLLRASMPSTIEFSTAIAGDVPAVLGDPTQIHQLVMNLGANACQAMADRPGRLDVRVTRRVVAENDPSAPDKLRAGVYACVSLRDNGCGMDGATRQRIFEPFFTTKPPGEGTGLGLAVVHGIMESHDGLVTVESEVGAGTVFLLYFPAHTGVAITTTETVQPIPTGHGERLLVVDDEAVLVAIIQKTLVALGYVVEGTTEPLEAFALVDANPRRYAAVLTDQTMPGMTGLHLASRLHRLRPDLPLILMSGNSVPLTPERIAAAGISHLLSKPVSLHALGSAVHAVLAAPARP